MRNIRKPSNKKLKNIRYVIIVLIVAIYIVIDLYGLPETPSAKERGKISVSTTEISEVIPEYSGQPAHAINNNKPKFTDDEYEKAQTPYIYLSELDSLGRCGTCEASLSSEIMPSEERGDISSVHPSGWNQALYPDLINKNGGALYNRCHLLMYALTGLNADPRNLITGTEYLNTKGMLPYEKAVQNWLIKKQGKVLYRITPDFKGNELVARGVLIEAADVETHGENFHINTYCYNVEPGIEINYKTGESKTS